MPPPRTRRSPRAAGAGTIVGAGGQAGSGRRSLRDEIAADASGTGPASEVDEDLADALDAAGGLAAIQRPADAGLAREPGRDAADAAGVQAAGAGLAAVAAALADISQRLSTADGLLKTLLARHAQAYQDATAIRPWAEE